MLLQITTSVPTAALSPAPSKRNTGQRGEVASNVRGATEGDFFRAGYFP